MNKKELDYNNLPFSIRQRLYKSQILKLVYNQSNQETTIYFKNAEKKNKEDFFSFVGRFSEKPTEHNLLVFLFKNKVLNPNKFWNLGGL
jgi:hypothetical protein